jgi:hypothetical protein
MIPTYLKEQPPHLATDKYQVTYTNGNPPTIKGTYSGGAC